MNFESVFVQARNLKDNTVTGTSGTLFNDRFAIVTFHAIANFFDSSYLSGINFRSKSLLVSDQLLDVSFIIHVKNDEENTISEHNARFKNLFHSERIAESTKFVFRNWSFDSSHDYPIECLSLFVLLEIDGFKIEKDDFEIISSRMPKTKLFKGQSLRCISTAFGNKEFINHFSQGIVSNIAGKDNCLIFSDIPLTPGCEGSPVFLEQKQAVIGIVISTINWWKGEWLNFTVIADLRQLMSEILDRNSSLIHHESMMPIHADFLRATECSIFQVYNGTIWGTAILIEKEKGILITNSHVVESPHGQIKLYQRTGCVPCEVVYSNNADYLIDIAVLKATEPLEEYCCKISFSKKEVKIGDAVFAAGFPFFSKEMNPSATITSGHVCHVHTCMMKTTCPIYPGASGGAILDERGNLIAVIVCNAKISDPISMIYPRLNMGVPAKLLQPIFETFIESGDIGVLRRLSEIDAKIWNLSFKL